MSEGTPKPAYLHLLSRIETFEELEVLLALFRQAGQSAEADLAARVMMAPPQVAEALVRLERSELIVRDAAGRSAIRRDQSHLEAAIRELDAEYESNRLGIMAQMNANAIERVRTSALRAFARAFLLGSKRDG